MPYLIETFDKANHQEVRQKYRDVHLEFLNKHLPKLLACGAKLNDDGTDAGGGIYIIDVDTREEAVAFIENDPFYKEADLFSEIKITRWRKSYFNGQCLL